MPYGFVILWETRFMVFEWDPRKSPFQLPLA